MQPLKQAIPGALVDIVRRAPLSPGKVAFAWGMAVGPAVQRNTDIRLDDGLLIIEAASRQWADEVRRSSRVIVARLHALLGDTAITRLEVRHR